jgi:Replication protein C N-terminal domain/Replication protein C C-terminal region
MTTSSQPGDSPGCIPLPPGERRLTPAMLAAETSAIPFAGLPEGVRHHCQVTETVVAALRLMGVSDGAITLARSLAGRIQARDWKSGSRPVCWPSNRCLQDELGITGRHLRRLIAELGEAGAVIMRDSGNMKRHGCRDAAGNIVTADTFGYDLSTWATCYSTFAAIVAEHKVHCQTRHAAWKAAKLDKRKIDRAAAIASATKAADLTSYTDRAAGLWADMEDAQDGSDHNDAARAAKTSTLAACAQRMELLRMEAVAAAVPETGGLGVTCGEDRIKNIEMSARADISVLLKNTTSKHLNSKFVQAAHENVASPATCIQQAPTEPAPQHEPVKPVAGVGSVTDPRNRNSEAWRDRAPWDGGSLKMAEVKTTAAELSGLVPELHRRLAVMSAEATWGNLSTVLREWAHDAGISKASIKHAEALLGWQSTYIGLAVVASKDGYHFDVSPGAYFNGGIVKRAQKGTLDLRATLWGLREGTIAAAPKPQAISAQTVVKSALVHPLAPVASLATLAGVPAQSPKASAAEAARANAASDRDEERAEIARAKAIRRTGPGQQSLCAAMNGALLPREIKRGLNAAKAPAVKPALPTTSVGTPANTPISEDPLAAEIEALMERRKAEEAQRLAVMTPAQRAMYDRREAQRLAICADYRRHPNR